MNMFCPSCGKENPNESTYCRRCGDVLPDLSKKDLPGWGRATPAQRIRTSLVLNLLSALLSLIMGVLLLSTLDNRGDKTFIISAAAGLLLTICIWQVSNFVIGMRLRKQLKRRDEDDSLPKAIRRGADRGELLPEADFENLVPASVTERTTNLLGDKPRPKASGELG
jgi:hypothetical protein